MAMEDNPNHEYEDIGEVLERLPTTLPGDAAGEFNVTSCPAYVTHLEAPMAGQDHETAITESSH
jgi:hypothetical protein